MISEENINLEKIRKLGKVLLSLIVFIGVIYCSFSLYLENERLRQEEERLKIEEANLIKQGYCPKTKTILTKEELYQTAMRDLLKKSIKERNKLWLEFESIQRNSEQDIWLSSPLNGKELRTLLMPVYKNEGSSQKKAKIFYELLKNSITVLKNVDSITIEKISPKNNGFNVYWHVIPPHFIYAYDCCTVYTKEEAIKRIRFLEDKKIYINPNSSDDDKLQNYPTAYRYFYFDLMFLNDDENIIENNAYGSYGYFVPIDTCGDWIVNILEKKNDLLTIKEN